MYREKRLKVVKQWNPENNTVTFQQNKTWYFEPSMSKGSLDDPVTTLNIPAIVSNRCFIYIPLNFNCHIQTEIIFWVSCSLLPLPLEIIQTG